MAHAHSRGAIPAAFTSPRTHPRCLSALIGTLSRIARAAEGRLRQLSLYLLSIVQSSRSRAVRMRASRPILQLLEQTAALGPQQALGEWANTRKQVGTLNTGYELVRRPTAQWKRRHGIVVE